MIEIDLLPPELRKKESFRFALPEVPIRKTLTAFLSLFLGLQAILTVYAWHQKLELSKLKREAARLTEETKEVARWKSETAVFETRLKEAGIAKKRNLIWASLLSEISSAVTKGIWLREFSVEEGAEAQVIKKKNPKGLSSQKVRYLRLDASAIGPGQETAYAGKFLKELKDRPKLNGLFDTIEISNINQKKIKDFDVYDFTIVCVFKKGKL